MTFMADQFFFKEFVQLKTKLLNLSSQQGIKTIMITACNEGDGVSTVARNLAAALSTGFITKVLLIDLNPKEQPADILKNANSINLAENIQKFITKEDNSLLDTITYMPENFSLVSMKPGFDYGSNLFHSDAFKSLFYVFKARYDYIIIDAPPVFSSSGRCLALGALVDGVILVLRAEHTKQEVAKNAKYQLESAGAKLFGAIINRKKYYIPDFIYKRL